MPCGMDKVIVIAVRGGRYHVRGDDKIGESGEVGVPETMRRVSRSVCLGNAMSNIFGARGMCTDCHFATTSRFHHGR